MSRTIHELAGLITANVSSFARGMASGVKATQQLAQTWGRAAKSIAAAGARTTAAVAGVGTAVVAAGRKFASAAEVQIKSEQKLQAALEATENAAGLTLKQISEFASARQQITDFGDEVTLSAAGVLATFKNLRGEGFLRTLAVAQDVSAQMGGDLQSSVLQLGKALNDPATGLTMLNRVGITFNKQQQERIKQLQEEGRLFEAQNLILEEVESQFGGTAERVSTSWTRMGNQLGDVVENIGFAFVPTFESIAEEVMALTEPLASNREQMEAWGEALASKFRDLLPLLKDFASGAWEMLRPLVEFVKAHPNIIGAFVALKLGGILGINRAIFDLGSAVGVTFMALGKIPGALRAVGSAMMFLAANPIGAVVAAIGVLVSGLTLFFTQTETGRRLVSRFGEIISDFAGKVSDILQPVWNRMVELWENRILPIISEIADAIGETLADAVDALVPLVEAGLVGAFEAFAWVLENVVVPVLKEVVDIIETAVSMVDRLIKATAQIAIKGAVGGRAGELAAGMAGIGLGAMGGADAKAQAPPKPLAAQHGPEKPGDEIGRQFGKKASEQAPGVGRQIGEESAKRIQEALRQAELAALDRESPGARRISDFLGLDGLSPEDVSQFVGLQNGANQGMANRFANEFSALGPSPGQAELDQLAQRIAGTLSAALEASANIQQNAADMAAATPMLRDFGASLRKLRDDGTLAKEVTNGFAREATVLRTALADGEISLDEFQRGMRDLTQATDEAVRAAKEKEEAERRAALRAGDFAGAGLDPRKALQQRIEQFQTQRFNQQIDRMFLAWQQANGYVERAGQGLQRLADTTGGLNRQFAEMKRTQQQQASGRGSGRAGQAARTLFSFLNSTAGRIATIINQISLLRQTLTLSNLSAQRRQQILAQIAGLQQEYLNIINRPPPVSLTSPEELFKDPGLQSEEEKEEGHRSNRGGTNITLNFRSLRTPDEKDARMIKDVLNTELQRTGHNRFF